MNRLPDSSTTSNPPRGHRSAPAAAPPIPTSTTGRLRDDSAEAERASAANRAEGNRQLYDLRQTLHKAERQAREWLKAGHGDGCVCPLCSYHADIIGHTAWDVAAIEWFGSRAAALLDAVAVGPAPAGTAR